MFNNSFFRAVAPTVYDEPLMRFLEFEKSTKYYESAVMSDGWLL